MQCDLFQGYHGCAIGKAKQAAKTEIEKLKVRLVHSTGRLDRFQVRPGTQFCDIAISGSRLKRFSPWSILN